MDRPDPSGPGVPHLPPELTGSDPSRYEPPNASSLPSFFDSGSLPWQAGSGSETPPADNNETEDVKGRQDRG